MLGRSAGFVAEACMQAGQAIGIALFLASLVALCTRGTVQQVLFRAGTGRPVSRAGADGPLGFYDHRGGRELKEVEQFDLFTASEADSEEAPISWSSEGEKGTAGAEQETDEPEEVFENPEQ